MAAESPEPRQAMILAAGVGERLRPLTDKRPKALAPIANLPVIYGTVRRLRQIGIERIVVNTHHLAGQVEAFLESVREDGLEIIISREDEILGTGGGPGRARDYFTDESLVLINGDILTDLDLLALWDYHLDSGDIATLAVHDYPEYNQVALDGDGRLVGVRDSLPGGEANVAARLAFTGVHVLSPDMFQYLPPDRPASIIDIYLELVERGITIGAFQSENHYWIDIGTPQQYLQAHLDLQAGLFDPMAVLGRPARLPDVGPGSQLGKGVILEGATVVGSGCRIGDGAVLSNTVVWDDVVVADGVILSNCVVGDGCRVNESAGSGVIA